MAVHGGLIHGFHVVDGGELPAHAPIQKIRDSEAVVDLVPRRGAFAENEIAAIVVRDLGNVLRAMEPREHADAPAQIPKGVRAAVLLLAVRDEQIEGALDGALTDRFAVVLEEVFDRFQE